MKEQSKEEGISVRDFLVDKFGDFNQNYPLSHLGYAKGLTPDIGDLIEAFQEWQSQQQESAAQLQSAPKQSAGEFELKIQEMQSLIEKQMEQWDREKKIKAAQAIEDLQKFIITT